MTYDGQDTSDASDYETESRQDELVERLKEEVGRWDPENPVRKKLSDRLLPALDRPPLHGGKMIHHLLEQVEDDKLDIFEPLLRLVMDESGDLTETNDIGVTPLGLGISRRLLETTKILCESVDLRKAQAAIRCLGFKRGNCVHHAIRRDAKIALYLANKADEATLCKQDMYGNTPLHEAVKYSRCSTADQLHLVKLLVDKCPQALETLNGEHLPPYRFHYSSRQKYLASGEARHKKRTRDWTDVANPRILEDCSNQIAAYIKQYCVRNLSRDKIMACLYELGRERHIDFDLSGLEHPAIKEAYLDRLSGHLQFESVLKYVVLPQITVESSADPGEERSSDKQLISRGRSDLAVVFSWLRRQGVRKIIKVIVIDFTAPSHSDASIEEAMQGFDVELWNWKRMDLSTEVIRKSTRCVREISLYSTGNNAVLMGWTSPHSLSDRQKFPELERVKLFVEEGLEDHDRLMAYLEFFKKEIEEQTKNQVKVYYVIDKLDIRYPFKMKSIKGDMQAEIPWYDCMANFSSLLRKAPTPQMTGRVKMAIIDDGIDAMWDGFDGKIASGKTFAKSMMDLVNPYYTSSSNHGTYMAMLICKICPEVSLYIAKVDESRAARSGERRITATSAAQAIRWATSCGVHIISMGWAMQPFPSPEAKAEILELKEAVQEAARLGILIFCSTSDHGSITTDEYFPRAFRDCIAIGASTHTGEPMPFVHF